MPLQTSGRQIGSKRAIRVTRRSNVAPVRRVFGLSVLVPGGDAKALAAL